MEKRFLFIPAGKPVEIPFEHGALKGKFTFPAPGQDLEVGMVIDIQQSAFVDRGLTAETLDELVVQPGKGKWVAEGTPAAKLKKMAEKPVTGKEK